MKCAVFRDNGPDSVPNYTFIRFFLNKDSAEIFCRNNNHETYFVVEGRPEDLAAQLGDEAKLNRGQSNGS